MPSIDIFYNNSEESEDIELIIYNLFIYELFSVENNSSYTNQFYNNKKNEHPISVRLESDKFILEKHYSFDKNSQVTLDINKNLVSELMKLFDAIKDEIKSSGGIAIDEITTKKGTLQKINFSVVENVANNVKKRVPETLSHVYDIIKTEKVNQAKKDLLASEFAIDDIEKFIVSIYLSIPSMATTQLKHWYIFPSFFIKKGLLYESFGTFIFNTEHRLDSYEVGILSLINNDIWKMINTLQIGKLSKDAQWKIIVDEMSHHNHHIYGAINNYQHQVDTYITKETTLDSAIIEEYERRSKPIHTIRKLLASTNDFLLAINKKSIDESLKLSPTLNETLEIKKVTLNKLLNNTFSIIDSTFGDIGFTGEKREDRVRQQYQRLKNEINQKLSENSKEDIIFSNNENAVLICFLELVKNALKFSDPVKPEVNVTYDIDKNRSTILTISNK